MENTIIAVCLIILVIIVSVGITIISNKLDRLLNVNQSQVYPVNIQQFYDSQPMPMPDDDYEGGLGGIDDQWGKR